MALIKVTDLAYGRLRAPDLDVAEEWRRLQVEQGTWEPAVAANA